ncbi:MAG: hypothetical protein ACKONH_10395, partial [Planctomycetia bacterium]
MKTPSVAHTCRCTWWFSAEPRAGGCGGGGVNRHGCRSAQQPLDLSKKDLREGGDGLGAFGEEA